MQFQYIKLFQIGAHLTVVYRDRQGEISERNVVVRRRYISREGERVAKVWCELRQGERDLRLDRVLFAAPYDACTHVIASVPPGFDCDVLIADAAWHGYRMTQKPPAPANRDGR